MPAIIKPPTWKLVGQMASYDATPKWELAEAFVQSLMHKHKNIRNHASRREAVFLEIERWISYARKIGPAS